jgi:hypothetical protein
MRSLKEHICEGLLRGEEATLIAGDDFVKRPEIALNVKCKDIDEVAEVVGKCVGKKIKVKKMKGKWCSSNGGCINVDGCPGFAIEHIDILQSSQPKNCVDRKLYFVVWEGRLVCKQDMYYYKRKKTDIFTVLTPKDLANPKNYSKVTNNIGVVGAGLGRRDWVYHWGEDTLWDWFTESGFERFFDKI